MSIQTLFHSQRKGLAIACIHACGKSFFAKGAPVRAPSRMMRRGIDLAKVEKARNVLEFDTYMMTPFNGYAVSRYSSRNRISSSLS